MALTEIHDKPYIFCGIIGNWSHSILNNEFAIPLIESFPRNARYMQLKQVEVSGLPSDMHAPFGLFLYNCVLSGIINEFRSPVVYYSGLNLKTINGPICQLVNADSFAHLNRLQFKLHFVDMSDVVNLNLAAVRISFHVQFFR